MIGSVNGVTTKALDHARAYRAAGLSPVPVRTDGSKRPPGSWTRFQSDRVTESELPSLFGGNVGVGIVHGAVSGGTEVIDIDTGDMLDPFVEALDHAAPGLYLKLCTIKTPRPGYHLYYRCDAPEGNQKLARRPPTSAEVEAAAAKGEKAGPVVLIETRGEGGFTVAPGSPGACHPTGGEYRHLEGPPLTELSTLTDRERNALLQAARSLDQMPLEEPVAPRSTTTSTYSGTSPGDEYAASTSWAEILEPHGWAFVGDSQQRKLWRRPGKSLDWSATTGNVSTAGNELLCVFSTNAHPFDGPDGQRNCSTHTKFDAYARLNHEGDYSAAAKELARLGYGDRPKVEYADPALRDLDPSAPPERERPREPIPKFSLRELKASYPKMAPPVVDGLIRAGETCNIIAAPKVGKSWLGYGLALSVASGSAWLDRFDVAQGRVLIIDNELHRATLANRLPAVAEAMGLPLDLIEDDIDIWPLRGDLRSLGSLGAEFEKIERGHYKLVILDAKYRLAEPGQSENDNAAETQVYNLLDKYAAKLGAAFVLIHHASKGDQSGKAVTDVGAGAGAQARATDCHLVIRPHEEDGCAVLDAAVRSFAPVDPVVIRWAFPVWITDDRLDPAKLAGRNGKAATLKAQEDNAYKTAILGKLAEADGPLTRRNIRSLVGLGDGRATRLLDELTSESKVVSEDATIHGNACIVYSLPQSGDVDGVVQTTPDHLDHVAPTGVVRPLKGDGTTPPVVPEGGPGEESPPDHVPTAPGAPTGPMPFAEFEAFAEGSP